MDTATPRRFEDLLDQALFVGCFQGHYSVRTNEAAARILIGAYEWSPAAEGFAGRVAGAR